MVVAPIEIRERAHQIDEDEVRVKKQMPIINFKSDDHRQAVLEKRSEPFLYDIDSSRGSKKDQSKDLEDSEF